MTPECATSVWLMSQQLLSNISAIGWKKPCFDVLSPQLSSQIIAYAPIIFESCIKRPVVFSYLAIWHLQSQTISSRTSSRASSRLGRLQIGLFADGNATCARDTNQAQGMYMDLCNACLWHFLSPVQPVISLTLVMLPLLSTTASQPTNSRTSWVSVKPKMALLSCACPTPDGCNRQLTDWATKN